jgi:hypothetical protein
MSGEKLKESKDDPAATQCLASVSTPMWLKMDRAESRYRSSMSSAALEERAQDSLQEERARGFALFNIPHIAKSLMPVDNEPKHGAWQSRFAAIPKGEGNTVEESKRFHQLTLLQLPDGRNALMDYCVYRRELNSSPTSGHFF